MAGRRARCRAAAVAAPQYRARRAHAWGGLSRREPVAPIDRVGATHRAGCGPAGRRAISRGVVAVRHHIAAAAASRVWTALARFAWVCGWSAGVESFKSARTRAAEAARILIARAEAHGSVALMGHGFMNILISGRLRAQGWTGPRFPRLRHWAFGVYVH